MMFRLAVLDMAGTTIDDRGAVYEALRGCIEEVGVSVSTDDLQQWMGTDKSEAIAALLIAGSPSTEPTQTLVHERYSRFRQLLEEAYREQPPVALPGVTAALNELRQGGIQVFLSTGFDHDVADSLIDSLGWTPTTPGSPIDGYVCSDDVSAGRPAPYMIFRAMELAGVQDVSTVIAAGDTHVDLQAGSNARAGVVAGVLTGALSATELATQPHTHILTSVAELPGLVLA